MNTEALNMIVKAVVTIVTVLITAYVIPWLKSKVDADSLKKVEEYCEFAVRCAEQLFTVEEFAKKKEYVMEYITKKVEEFGITLTAEDINTLVESTVNAVKKG